MIAWGILKTGGYSMIDNKQIIFITWDDKGEFPTHCMSDKGCFIFISYCFISFQAKIYKKE